MLSKILSYCHLCHCLPILVHHFVTSVSKAKLTSCDSSCTTDEVKSQYNSADSVIADHVSGWRSEYTENAR
jgi:hypothetical protein